MSSGAVGGPLSGVQVVEIAGLGPVPYAAMMLADMGADVVRIDRADLTERQRVSARENLLNRGRRSVALDLKSEVGRAAARRMLGHADVVMEGFRAGVAERLGLGPDECMRDNPRLVYARVSGWGQTATNRGEAGHDINFVAASGLLDTIGTDSSGPVPPLMYLGDFAGGGLTCAFAIASALVERTASGRGQVIDASILDGTSLLGTMLHGSAARGRWNLQRGANAYDTGSHYFNVYATRDGRYMAVGAIEPQFYARFLEVLGITDVSLEDQTDPATWPALKQRIVELFRTRDFADWVRAFDTVDACVSPVLTMREAAVDRRYHAAEAFIEHDGVLQPAPSPRFSRTPGTLFRSAPLPGQHSAEVLTEHGFTDEQIAAIIGQPEKTGRRSST